MISYVNKWHTHLVVLLTWVVWGMPIFFGLIYTFDFFHVLDAFGAVMIGLWLTLSTAVLYFLYLFIHRHKLKQNYALAYRNHYGGFLVITALGMVGFVTLFLAFGGPKEWSLHVLLALFFINYLFAISIGKNIFKVELF